LTKQDTAERADAIAAAADKFVGDDLPLCVSSEYMRGICEVLADTFGVDDSENAKTEIWEEISAAHADRKLDFRARRIAHDVEKLHLDPRSADKWSLDQRRTLVTALNAAVRAGLTAAASDQEKETAR
jgi:hypothetical protein